LLGGGRDGFDTVAARPAQPAVGAGLLNQPGVGQREPSPVSHGCSVVGVVVSTLRDLLNQR